MSKRKNQQDDYLEDLKIKGDANAEIGNYEEAIKNYNEALQINPEFSIVLNDRGNANTS